MKKILNIIKEILGVIAYGSGMTLVVIDCIIDLA